MTAIHVPVHGAARPVRTRAVAPPRLRSAEALARRRRTATVALAALLVAGAALLLPRALPSATSGAVAGAHFRPVAQSAYVVQPGDTLWSIARSVQPSGDVRPLVQELAAQRGGVALRAGERLLLPASP